MSSTWDELSGRHNASFIENQETLRAAVPSPISDYTSVEDALSKVRSKMRPRHVAESVPVDGAFHRVSSRQVFAPHDVPKLSSSHMDGFAVISKDTGNARPSRPLALELVGAAGPGARSNRTIKSGEAVQVATGAMLPPGADAVVPKEHAEVSGGKVFVKLAVEPGSFVYHAGGDFRKGEVVLAKGRRVRAQDIGLMIGLGFARMDVWTRPKVKVIATGSELTRSIRPEAGKTRESHSHVFMSLISSLGCVPLDGGVIGDDPRTLAKALRSAVATSDFVVTLGGTSAGGKDLIVDAVAGLRPDVLIHGIKLDRGRVTGVACVRGKPVLMLPGPIQAAMNAFLILGVPLAEELSGWERQDMEFVCKLGSDWEGRKRFSDFKKVVYVRLRKGDETTADPLLGETESIRILTDADAYLVVPEGVTRLTAGTPVKVRLVPGFSDNL